MNGTAVWIVRDDPNSGWGDQGERVSQLTSPSIREWDHLDDRGLNRFSRSREGCRLRLSNERHDNSRENGCKPE